MGTTLTRRWSARADRTNHIVCLYPLWLRIRVRPPFTPLLGRELTHAYLPSADTALAPRPGFAADQSHEHDLLGAQCVPVCAVTFRAVVRLWSPKD